MKVSLISTLILLLLLNSCADENNKQSLDSVTTEEAKSWFANYQKPSTEEIFDISSQTENEKNSNVFKRQIFWEKAKKLKGGKLPNGLRIPIWYENDNRFGKQALRELMVYKTKDGKLSAEMVEIVATQEYFKRKGKIDMKDFSGIITFHDWKKGFKAGALYENGAVAGYLSDYKIYDLKTWKPDGKNNSRTNCGGYQYSYVQNGVLVIAWMQDPCYSMSYFWMMYLNDPYNSYYNQYLDAQYGCEVTGSCQNYDSNQQYTPYYEPEIRVPIITNNVTNPCIRQQAENAVSLSAKNEISDLARTFFGINQDVNLDFNQSGSLENSVDAVTETFRHNNNDDWLDIIISYNENTLPSASQEYIMATTYHELLHAILHHNNIYGPMQHDTMADYYIKIMKAAFKSSFNNLSDADAELLAWGGLQETEAWEKLSSNYKQRVLSINADYKSGQRGTKC